MPTYTVNLAVKVSTDGPIDGEAFMAALRNHYLEAGYDGRSPLPTENLYYWLNKMVKASVRAIAYDPVWDGPMLPGEVESWKEGVNPKLVRACDAADALEKAVNPWLKGIDVTAVEVADDFRGR